VELELNYQPNEPINLTYDAFGIASAFIRGLFTYLYSSDSLILIPRMPDSITSLLQKFPIRFGIFQIYISTIGICSHGITAVQVNEQPWKLFDYQSIQIPYNLLSEKFSSNDSSSSSRSIGGPQNVNIVITFGQQEQGAKQWGGMKSEMVEISVEKRASAILEKLILGNKANNCSLSPGIINRVSNWTIFIERMTMKGFAYRYETTHANLFLQSVDTMVTRCNMLNNGTITPLPSPQSQQAADQSYASTVNNLDTGLINVLMSYAESSDATKKFIYSLWIESP